MIARIETPVLGSLAYMMAAVMAALGIGHLACLVWMQLILIVSASVATAVVLGRMVASPTVIAGEQLQLETGERGVVRVVRCWYTVVDIADGTAVLVPNGVIAAGRFTRIA
jgi:hypothetical protein